MPNKTEVVCALPFTAKKGASYGFRLVPTLVVVEDGVAVHDTKRAADPASTYSVRGNKLVRTWNPAAQAKAAKRSAAARAALAAAPFKKLVASIEKKLKGKAKRFGDDGDDVRGFVIRAKKLVDKDAFADDIDAVIAFQKEARAAGAFAFLTRFPGDFDPYLAVVAVDDPFDALAIVEAGGEDTSDLAKTLRALDKAAGVSMTRVQHDLVSGRLARAPKEIAKHARALEQLGIEAESEGEIAKMLKSKELFLWWD